jgi:hypothetical protein
VVSLCDKKPVVLQGVLSRGLGHHRVATHQKKMPPQVFILLKQEVGSGGKLLGRM